MFKKAIVAGAVALASVGSYAASANLTVIGTITPEACAITLGNGGVVDYGSLSATAVKTYSASGSINGAYTLPTKTLQMDVTCSAPTAVALDLTDNRAASKLAINEDEVYRNGLGTSGTTNIGAFGIGGWGPRTQISTTVGGTLAAHAGTLIRAKNTTGAWTTASGLDAGYLNTTNALGFKANASDTTPAAVTHISTQLQIVPAVNKSLVDTSTTAITLDGSVTIGVEYV